MSWNPFGTISSYKEMLAKIAIFTFVSTVAALGLLSYQIPEVSSFFRQWPVKIPVEGLELPLIILVSGLVVATVARIIKLHDRISDILGLRRRFDVAHILSPMASSVGVTVNESVLKARRREIMRKVFYRYASSGQPVIDAHYVTMAMDQWSWFWVLIESIPIWIVVGVVLAVYERFIAAGLVVAGLVAAAIILAWSWGMSAKYAKQQVDEILSDGQRYQEVKGVLSALPS